MAMTRSTQRSSTVDHALSVLLMFLRHDSISLKEVTQEVDISRTSAFRIMATLEDRGFLKRDGTRRQRMGPVFMQLMRRHSESRDIVGIARPLMRELMQSTAESVYISVRSGADKYMILDGFDSPQRIRWCGDRGEERSIYAGSGGKAHLAFCPDRQIEKLLAAAPLRRYTANTITDVPGLWADIRQIREQGYAISHGEVYKDALGVSAPILGPRGEVTAVLSVFLPTVRAERVSEIATELLATARRIGEMYQAE